MKLSTKQLKELNHLTCKSPLSLGIGGRQSSAAVAWQEPPKKALLEPRIQRTSVSASELNAASVKRVARASRRRTLALRRHRWLLAPALACRLQNRGRPALRLSFALFWSR